MAVSIMPKSNNKKKHKRPRPTPPQPGDADYKTPTQLRNARKRQKLRREKGTDPNDTSGKKGGSAAPFVKGPSGAASSQDQDPSLRYLANPKDAPTVRKAIQFFEEIFRSQDGSSSRSQYPATGPCRFPVIVGPKEGWRSVARLAVRAANGVLRIGLFVPGTHELLAVPDCQVHHPRINSLVSVLQKKCRHHRVDAFDEATGEGNLRHVAVAIERSTGRQQLVLVWRESEGDNNAEQREQEQAKLEALVQTLVSLSQEQARKKAECPNQRLTEGPIQLQSLWVHYNNAWKHSNSILDRNGRWEQKFGPAGSAIEVTGVESMTTPPGLEELLIDIHPNLHVPLYFPPQVFRQANLDGFAKIIIRIREWLSSFMASSSASSAHEEEQEATKESSGRTQERLGHCLELYGGVGTIGLHLVDLVSSLESSDENPFNKMCFEASVANLHVDKPLQACRKDKLTYRSKPASDMIHLGALQGAQIVIVDPPRKGMDVPVLDALCNPKDGALGHPDALIYVSCGFDAFQHDYDALIGSGTWKLDHAEGHLLFPGSDAIETLAFFKRSGTKGRQ